MIRRIEGRGFVGYQLCFLMRSDFSHCCVFHSAAFTLLAQARVVTMRLGFLKNRSFGEVTGMKLGLPNAGSLDARRSDAVYNQKPPLDPVRTTTATPFASRSGEHARREHLPVSLTESSNFHSDKIDDADREACIPSSPIVRPFESPSRRRLLRNLAIVAAASPAYGTSAEPRRCFARALAPLRKCRRRRAAFAGYTTPASPRKSICRRAAAQDALFSILTMTAGWIFTW